jgi:hypothetical protein
MPVAVGGGPQSDAGPSAPLVDATAGDEPDDDAWVK